ncbi:MAG: hypothetical protein JWM95_4328, partial [Gemmatimonadetes bacterium]|nr:hypothetical protein [Gemmatimonadota bacterium]
LVSMDPVTGALQKTSALDAGPNPSFLAVHPSGHTLLAVNEARDSAGAVRSFAIDAASGGLAPLSGQSSEGSLPCYVSTDRTGYLAMAANYGSGTIALLPVSDAGTLSPASQVVQHVVQHVVQQVGNGKIAARQDRAHAHCIVAHPNNRFVLAADLGVDRVLVYGLDAGKGTLTHHEERDAVMPAGTGPRHLAFHPTLPLVFVTGELSSTVTALRCDPETSALSSVQTLATTPRGWTGENFPAHVQVDAAGRTLYVTNRGHNSIAVFSIAAGSGALALHQVLDTGGNWPRHFALDPTERWLLVANQRSGSLVVFTRDASSGLLAPASQRMDVVTPACIVFRPVR